MPIVAIISRKGGVGKSTIAANLAVLGGEGVVLLDTDPQASLADWRDRRPSEYLWPEVQTVPPARVSVALRRCMAPWVLMDTQPGDSELLTICTAADFLLLVVRPGQFDLDAIGCTLAAMKTSNKPGAIVINQAHPQASLDSLTTELSELGYPVAPAIRFRADVEHGNSSGLGVTEQAPDSKAAAEVQMLWSWLKEAIAHAQKV